MLKKVLCYTAVCLVGIFAALCISCTAPDTGTETQGSVTQSGEVSVTESERATDTAHEKDTESEALESSDTESATSVREPAADGFPNEAESGGTKRY